MLSKLLVFGKYIYIYIYTYIYIELQEKCIDFVVGTRYMGCKRKTAKKRKKKKNTVTTPRSAHYLPSKVLLNKKTEIREEK